MPSAMHFPGPRDGLDEGSLTELARDGREIEIEMDEQGTRQRVAAASGPIDVPEDAPALIDGLPAYGACS
jgi:hypothetical protein